MLPTPGYSSSSSHSSVFQSHSSSWTSAGSGCTDGVGVCMCGLAYAGLAAGSALYTEFAVRVTSTAAGPASMAAIPSPRTASAVDRAGKVRTFLSNRRGRTRKDHGNARASKNCHLTSCFIPADHRFAEFADDGDQKQAPRLRIPGLHSSGWARTGTRCPEATECSVTFVGPPGTRAARDAGTPMADRSIVPGHAGSARTPKISSPTRRSGNASRSMAPSHSGPASGAARISAKDSGAGAC